MDEPSGVGPFSLSEHPLHLGLGASSIPQPRFTGDMAWYEGYGRRHGEDGAEGRLLSMHTFHKPWDTWEMHPKGSEVVLVTDGELILHQDQDGNVTTSRVRAGELIINPPGAWHTADASAPVTAVFITCGEGTEIRPR